MPDFLKWMNIYKGILKVTQKTKRFLKWNKWSRCSTSSSLYLQHVATFTLCPAHRSCSARVEGHSKTHGWATKGYQQMTTHSSTSLPFTSSQQLFPLVVSETFLPRGETLWRVLQSCCYNFSEWFFTPCPFKKCRAISCPTTSQLLSMQIACNNWPKISWSRLGDKCQLKKRSLAR